MTGVVLAGGKSSRFGQDKGLYPFRGKPLAYHALNIVRPHCRELLISANDHAEAYNQPVVHTIQDIYPDCGPLGGIHSALYHAEHRYIAIISCDSPFIPSEIYDFLYQNMGDHQCIMPAHNHFIETMCAIYTKDSLSVIEKAIRSGTYKIIEAVKQLNCHYLNIERTPFYYPDIFHNINYPEDL